MNKSIDWDKICNQCPYKSRCDYVSKVCGIDSDWCDSALEMYLDEEIDEEQNDD